MDEKITVLLNAAQALLNAYSKGAPPADADSKMAALLGKARLVRELAPDLPVARSFLERVRELVVLRSWKDID